MDDASLEGRVQTEFTRLTIKLDTMQWPFDINIALRVLQDIGYVPIEQSQALVRATKADGGFFMDRPNLSIRFDGTSLSTVTVAKKSFEESLERNADVVLDNLAAYYQSEYVLIYLSKKNIHDVLDNVYNDSYHMKAIRTISGKDVRPYLIDVSSRGSYDNKTWFRVRIEPKAEGTDKTYFCSAVCRDTSMDGTISDAKGAELAVKKMLRMLESKSNESETART